MSRGTALLSCLMLSATAAYAQTRWVADPKTSLAWWQVDPHLNHLWATTCPGDSSWRPGEGRSSGWWINPALKLPKHGYANVSDTIHMPLYPRPAGSVHPSCVEAVRAEVWSADTVRWRGVRGEVRVRGEALLTGEGIRDLYMHHVMQTTQYPEILFTLDSVTDLKREADTLRGVAFGTFELHGVKKPVSAVVSAYPEFYLNLGIGTGIWHDLFMGVDLVFHPENASSRGMN